MRTQKEILKKYLDIDEVVDNFTYDNNTLKAVKKTLRWVIGDDEHKFHHIDIKKLAKRFKLS